MPSSQGAKLHLQTLQCVCCSRCRLYKSLGNYDAVRGIFGSHVGTKGTTKDALEAEERVEYADALQLYKEVREWGWGAAMQRDEGGRNSSLLPILPHLLQNSV